MGKKSSQKPASKTSSAAAFGAADATYTGNKSSILKAAFAPSDYQLALFASVIQGLEGQNLRIHDTNTCRLQCEHVLGPKELVTSLDWGHYAGRREQAKKKRKRPSDVNGTVDGLDQGDVVVAFGTSTSDIRMYSPAEDKIVGTLAGGHIGGVKDFKFTAGRPQEGWSVGGDHKLVQWDLVTGQRTKVIDLSTTSAFTTLSRPVPSNPPVICASQTPYIVNLEDELPSTFPAMRNPIQTIITSSTTSVADGPFLASDNDRYINVFDPISGQIAMNLVADKEVTSLSLYSKQNADAKLALEKQVLAAVTVDGTIELFARPFVRSQLEGSKSNSLKARSMQMTRRAESSIKITKSSTSDDLVPVVALSFQGSDLLVAWAHGGIIPLFERVKWLNEETEELAFTGVKNIAKTKSSSILQSATTNGAKNANETHVSENRVVVEQGNLADDDIDMEDSKNDAVSEDGSEVDDDDDDDAPKQQKHDKKAAESDVEMENAAESNPEDEDDEEEGEEETGEPTFGELMRAHAAEEIDVEAELEDDVHTRSLIPGKPITTVQAIPSGVSLLTVLSQSLKTNDYDMLEACFHTGDTGTIRTTIQRLDSPLAATLLQRLAERLSARPGRYGHLLVWVQWTCIAHGGALAGNRDLLKQMSTLFKVMDQRSSTLSSLLLLKGKLDMLDAQLGLRQSLRENADQIDSDDEENVIYVEGYDDEEDGDSDAENTKTATNNNTIDTPRTKAIRGETDISMLDDGEAGSEDDDEEDDDDDDEEEEDEEDATNILDVEAEESAGSSDAEESLDEGEDEEGSDAESAASMADFIADTEGESDGEELSRPPPSKKARIGSQGGSGGGKGKKQAGLGRK
ncbi:Dip2/Utp12 family-domain-containing protein [Aspergillus undulatus]|uniref:Dip2/Utp12 family-domain-containing protein n=1 Tax=Aspergillus undulatus TaxID=1810928 RepID=UPI003CCC9301